MSEDWRREYRRKKLQETRENIYRQTTGKMPGWTSMEERQENARRQEEMFAGQSDYQNPYQDPFFVNGQIQQNIPGNVQDPYKSAQTSFQAPPRESYAARLRKEREEAEALHNRERTRQGRSSHAENHTAPNRPGTEGKERQRPQGSNVQRTQKNTTRRKPQSSAGRPSETAKALNRKKKKSGQAVRKKTQNKQKKMLESKRKQQEKQRKNRKLFGKTRKKAKPQNPKERITIGMRRKLTVCFALFLCGLLVIAVEIFRVSAKNGEEYSKKVLSQKKYDITSLPYRRGDILDTNGIVLATSEEVYNVILDCKVLHSNTDFIQPTKEALSKAFPELDKAELEKRIEEKKDSAYQVLLKQITYDQKKKFEDMIVVDKTKDTDEEKKWKSNVKAVNFEKQYLRTYPNKSLACKVVGFSESGNVGTWGVEGSYNSVLNGTEGVKYFYMDQESNYKTEIEEATDGNSVELSLDLNIQKTVEKSIKGFLKEHKNESRKGNGAKNIGVLVMKPKTGEILAMADKTEYDLNNPHSLNLIYSTSKVNQMISDGLLDENGVILDSGEFKEKELTEINEKMYSVWRNSCISDTYEAGSTIKPFTVATALEIGALNGEETFYCDGGEQIGPKFVKCSNHSGHGTITLEESLMYSCNDALMQMAFQIGKENFTKYQNLFHFGLKTGVDLPGEAYTANLLYSADQISDIDLATNSFGQNFNATMIQVAAAYSSIINGGFYYQPHIAKKILDSSGNTVKTVEPVLLKQTVSKETSEKLKTYLQATASRGTGKTAKVNGYSMGGKTGTAEVYPRGKGNYLVSFIGHAPADDPEVVVYCIIDRPNVDQQADSKLAQKVVKSIMEEILPYLGIRQDEELLEEDENGTIIPGKPAVQEPQDEEGTTEDGQTPEEETAPQEDASTQPQSTEGSAAAPQETQESSLDTRQAQEAAAEAVQSPQELETIEDGEQDPGGGEDYAPTP